MSATPTPFPGPGIEALAADFPPWHFWWSTPSPGRQPRLCASRAFPTHPHAKPDPSRKFTPCGMVLDADTPAGMRKLLEERS